MYSIDQLEAFVATAKTGSFSSAARSLNKAQSVVSQHVINLEIDCNAALFDRSGRYPQLTQAGEKLLSHAQVLLAQHQRLRSCAQHLDKPFISELTIGLDEGIPFQKLSSMVNQLEIDFPNTALEFFTASSIDIVDLIDTDRAVTGIIFSELSLPSHIDYESIGSIKFDIYVASAHPLAQQQVNNLANLKLHRQLLMRSRNNKSSDFQLALSPDIWYADNYYVLLELTLQGNGWCLLPNHIANEYVNNGQLVLLPSEFNDMGWHANVDVIQHHRYSLEPMFKQFRHSLRQLLTP
ncbi:LysR family transcriptional regulator [Shewanella saliphila]|uniref:Transcriptional regulator n=1 Tax=Shewanella saliphila TaxID=2282698 RepID=A0ABQ2Q8Q8_9GAMM|nr:LysR family transcriptional regulator [Shewanella saliphila]MCL1103088.1 LysR family transcriptional regulator [Shewanella saliphila]GGP60143.1 transcriptional regulator [Shewanella saliphila]